MAESTVELQKLIWQTLNDDADVTCEIYDHVPETAQYPYITFGAEDWTPVRAECIEGYDVNWQIDVWNDEPGRIRDIRPLMHAAILALDAVDLVLPDPHKYDDGRLISATITRDPDGVTTHGQMQFNFQIS